MFIVIDARGFNTTKLCSDKALYCPKQAKRPLSPSVLTGGNTIQSRNRLYIYWSAFPKTYVLHKITRASVFAIDEPGRFYTTDEQNKLLVKEEMRFSKNYI